MPLRIFHIKRDTTLLLGLGDSGGQPSLHCAHGFQEFPGLRASEQGDGPKLFPGEGMEAVRADVEPPPGNPPLGQIRLMAADYDHIKREAKTLKARFNEISH